MQNCMTCVFNIRPTQYSTTTSIFGAITINGTNGGCRGNKQMYDRRMKRFQDKVNEGSLDSDEFIWNKSCELNPCIMYRDVEYIKECIKEGKI